MCPRCHGSGDSHRLGLVSRLVALACRPVARAQSVSYTVRCGSGQAACYLCYRPPRLTSPLEVPVLLIGGDEDLMHSVAAMRATAERLGGQFVQLAGVGHNSFMQAAAQVNELLAAHLAAAA